MTYNQGNKRSVGIAIEDVRGQAQQPTYWIQRADFSFAPKGESVDTQGVTGSLVGTTGSKISKERSEGNIGGRIYPNAVGYFLFATLGAVSTDNNGANPLHTFTLEENNAHPSLTVSTIDPVAGWHYPLTVINAFGLSAEAGGDLSITTGLKGKKQQSATGLTREFTDEESFGATNMKVMLADDMSSLDTATNICMQSFDMTITKESEDINCISSKDALDFVNKQVTIEGSFEMYWEDDTYKEIFFNDVAKAMRIHITDTNTDLDGEHPELIIDLAKVQFSDWTDAVSLDDLIKQTVSFKAHYSIKDSKAIEAKLRNTQQSY